MSKRPVLEFKTNGLVTTTTTNLPPLLKDFTTTEIHPTTKTPELVLSNAFYDYQMPPEELSVFPKFLNTSEEDSFQLECKYTGHQYLTLKLVWFKNDLVMRLRKEPHRIIHLDYKQNLTRISILKLTRSQRRDSGLYKCVAFDEKRAIIGEEHLKLLVNQSTAF